MDEKKVASLKHYIKSETTRLSSLTIPRDLSLGGTKPKKIYTPNLNVVRNKNKASPAAIKAQITQKKRSSQRQPQDPNNPRYIQSTGVFSEGTFQLKRPTIHSDKHATAREQDTSSGMKKPTFGRNLKVNVKEENTVVNDLLTCINDDSDSSSEDEYQPLVLPLSSNNNGVGFFKRFGVKKESDVDLKCNGVSPKVEVAYTVSSFTNLTTEFDDDNGPISIIKMPDTLPGKGFDENDKPADYSAGQMVEGYVGKIIVRKSGKTEVIIGKTKYSLDASNEADFTEELVSIPSKEEFKKNATIMTFGQVNEKFVLAPTWPDLLNEKKKKV